MAEPAAEAIAAATVVPLRDGPTGLEVLMLRKNSKLAFGGMWVFPGGRVDDADIEAEAAGDELAVARRAAVREAVEEAGIVIDPLSLIPFAHWQPPGNAPKRFVTWFFLAPVREAVDVVIDMGEIHDHGWLSPADALAQRDAGRYELAPPTWMTLWRLARSVDVDTALQDARTTPPTRYMTRIAFDGPIVVAVWAGDVAYTSGDLAEEGTRHRLYMDPAGWRHEHTA